MGNSDLVYLLFPFVLSVILVLAVILCCLKCKLLVDHPHGKTPSPTDDPGFGNLINIQEYAENQIGTTIVYAESPTNSTPRPYMYFTDGHSATIVPIQAAVRGSISCPSTNRSVRTVVSTEEKTSTSPVCSMSASHTSLSISLPTTALLADTANPTPCSHEVPTSDEENNESTVNDNANSLQMRCNNASKNIEIIEEQSQSLLSITQRATTTNANDAEDGTAVKIIVDNETKTKISSDPPPPYANCINKITTN